MKKPVVVRLPPQWDVLPLDLPLDLLLPVLDLLLVLRIHHTVRAPDTVVIRDTTVPLRQTSTALAPVPRPVLLQAQAMARRRIPVVLLGLPNQATRLRRTGTELLLPILDTVLRHLNLDMVLRNPRMELPLLSLGTVDLLQAPLDTPRDHHMDKDRLLPRGIKG